MQPIFRKSDHFPVIVEFKKEEEQMPRSTWDLRDINWQSLGSSLSKKLKDYNFTTDCPDIEVSRITDLIIKHAEEKIPKITISKHSKPFFTAELKNLQDQVRAAQRRYRRKRDEFNHRQLEDIKAEYNAKYDAAKKHWFDKVCEDIDDKDSNKWHIINKVLKGGISAPVQPLIRPDNEYDFEDDKILNRMIQL